MGRANAFNKIAERNISELGSRALVFEHKKTGGRVLSMINADENKVFGISFRTPPADSTGLPHILEHSVLCGSAKYPVKEPFVELLKGSLQTFLNALTFPDKTCYPVASANTQDFYNLIDVYLDAVFHPCINEFTLKQEGWHYELDETGKKLTYKGVVFNEMKGAYSSPDGLLHEYSQQSLFPDTTYGLDSGGDPRVIPDLTFKQFIDFHRAHYHPSNGYAFFWGDDDPRRRLEILDDYFSRFDRGEPSASISLQTPFSAPAAVEKSYAATDEDAGAMTTVNFALGEAADPDLNLSLEILDHILIGLPSSPLRKALLDSGLGEDLAGVGLEVDLRQMYFSTGLKGVRPSQADEVEVVIMDTLRSLADDGVPDDDVEAAMNSVEFDLRENNTGNYPRGLTAMFKALSAWLYGGDPLDILAFEGPLGRLKQRLEANEPVFEDLVRVHFLDNPHRARVLLTPDTGLAERMEAGERARLDEALQSMSPEEVEQVRFDMEALNQLQTTPDTDEALAAIPRLSVDDLPARNQIVPIEAYEKGDARTILHNLETNGLVYLDLGFDLRPLPDRLLGYVPLFGRAILEMDTETTDYVTMTKRIARKTGGIEPQVLTLPHMDGSTVARLFLRGKATMDRYQELFDIILELLLLGRFDNRDRFRQMVLEAKARAEQRLVPAGHLMVASRLKARMHEAGLFNELMHGVSQLFFLRDLAERVESDFDSVLVDLREIRNLLFSKNNLIINMTAHEDEFDDLMPGVSDLTRALPDTHPQPLNRDLRPFPAREGLAIPAQVNYVGKGLDLGGLNMKFKGSANAVSKFLRAGFLWDTVRVQGGAYGAFSIFDLFARTLCLVSYRDPNLSSTIEAFDQVGGYLREVALSHDELEKSIIGAIGEMDAYMLPDAKGFASTTRYLTGVNDAVRQQVREDVLATRSGDYRHFAQAALSLADKGDVVVMGNLAALEESGLELEITKVL